MANKLSDYPAFLEVVRRSGLVSEEDLEQLVSELKEHGPSPVSPQAIADALRERGKLTAWQASNLLAGKSRGYLLGPYRLLRLLGKGGMGSVYLAEHQMMRRRCAIKVLPPASVNSESSLLSRFYREAQAVASLDHPNIVRAYDVNKDTSGKTEIHYLVMEYVEGRDLQVLVQKNGAPLDFLHAAELIQQAAVGLAHAHENNLIHRDIKPANLLVDTHGVVKILDLGLARFGDESMDASLTHQFSESTLGTADYLAPEQALNSHDVDARADIYSLGCTLYFLLTARPPFPEGTVAQRLLSHQLKSPAPIAEFRPDVPADLLAIVERMMAKKREDRFPTAAAVAGALSAWLQTHANDAWKRQHPHVCRGDEGSGPGEPTRAFSGAVDDTDVELGFKPEDEEESPAEASGKLSPGGLASNAPPPEPLEEIPTLEAVDVPELPAHPASQDSGLSSLDMDLLSVPLEEVSPAPLPGQPSDSGLTGVAARDSGSGAGRRNVPPGGFLSQHPVLVPILIGVGIALPLIVIPAIIYGISGGSESESGQDVAAIPSSASLRTTGSGAQPSAAEETPRQGASTTRTVATSPTGPRGTVAEPSGSEQDQPRVNGSPPGNRPPGPDRRGGDPAVPLGDPTVPGEDPAFPAEDPALATDDPALAGADPGMATDDPAMVGQDPALAGEIGGGREPAGNVPRPPDGREPRGNAGGAEPAVDAAGKPAAGEPSSPVPGAGPDEPDSARPSPKLDADELQRRFAAVEKVLIRLDSVDKRKSKFNLTVVRTCIDFLERAEVEATLETDGKGNVPVLALELKADAHQAEALDPRENRKLVDLSLTAELKCPVEGSGLVSVWRHEDEIGTVSVELLQRDSVPPFVRSNLRKFFARLWRDHDQANEDLEAKGSR